MKKSFVFTSAIAVMLMAGACHNNGKSSVNNADSTNSANADSGTVSMSADETSFMVNAANGGMTEVKMGQLAEQKARNQRVKDFAAMMERDHSQANDQLKSLAMNKNVTLPDSLGEDSKDAYQDLSKKQGTDFDKAYMKMMLNDHQKTVDAFQKEAENAKDADLKSWIVKTLPALRVHLDSATSINQLFNNK